MSFETFKEFEESLQAARAKRRIPNVNKVVLKKVIQSTEAHNRNQEEQEMWMKHFASKRAKKRQTDSSEDSGDKGTVRKRKKKKRKRDKFKAEREKEKIDRLSPRYTSASNIDSHKHQTVNGCSSSKRSQRADAEPEIGPNVEEFLVSSNQKWGHDGYHELYRDEIVSDSNSDVGEVVTKKHKKKRSTLKKRKSKWVEKVEIQSSDDDRYEKKRRKKDR